MTESTTNDRARIVSLCRAITEHQDFLHFLYSFGEQKLGKDDASVLPAVLADDLARILHAPSLGYYTAAADEQGKVLRRQWHRGESDGPEVLPLPAAWGQEMMGLNEATESLVYWCAPANSAKWALRLALAPGQRVHADTYAALRIVGDRLASISVGRLIATATAHAAFMRLLDQHKVTLAGEIDGVRDAGLQVNELVKRMRVYLEKEARERGGDVQEITDQFECLKDSLAAIGQPLGRLWRAVNGMLPDLADVYSHFERPRWTPLMQLLPRPIAEDTSDVDWSVVRVNVKPTAFAGAVGYLRGFLAQLTRRGEGAMLPGDQPARASAGDSGPVAPSQDAAIRQEPWAGPAPVLVATELTSEGSLIIRLRAEASNRHEADPSHLRQVLERAFAPETLTAMNEPLLPPLALPTVVKFLDDLGIKTHAEDSGCTLTIPSELVRRVSSPDTVPA